MDSQHKLLSPHARRKVITSSSQTCCMKSLSLHYRDYTTLSPLSPCAKVNRCRCLAHVCPPLAHGPVFDSPLPFCHLQTYRTVRGRPCNRCGGSLLPAGLLHRQGRGLGRPMGHRGEQHPARQGLPASVRALDLDLRPALAMIPAFQATLVSVAPHALGTDLVSSASSRRTPLPACPSRWREATSPLGARCRLR